MAVELMRASARRIALYARGRELTAAELAHLSDAEWASLIAGAGMPSASTRICALAVDLLLELEDEAGPPPRSLPDDPYEGL